MVHSEVSDIEARTEAVLDDIGEMASSGHTPPPGEGVPKKGDHRALMGWGDHRLEQPESIRPMADPHIEVDLTETRVKMRLPQPAKHRIGPVEGGHRIDESTHGRHEPEPHLRKPQT